MGRPPVAGGRGEAVLPTEAGQLSIMQAAEAVATMRAEEAEATASPSKATASPPEAAGCPEEAPRTRAEGAAGPSELFDADPTFF